MNLTYSQQIGGFPVVDSRTRSHKFSPFFQSRNGSCHQSLEDGPVFLVHTKHRKGKLALRAVDFAYIKVNPLNIPTPVDACIVFPLLSDHYGTSL